MAIHASYSGLRAVLLTLGAFALGSTATPSSAQIVRSTVAPATASTSISTTPTPTPASGANAAISSATLAQATELIWEGVAVVAPACDANQRAETFESAGPGNTSVSVDCSFTMFPPERITKRLVFTGNTQGVTVDCQGGVIDGGPGSYLYDAGDRGANMVEVVSSPVEGSGLLRWSARPRNITIRNCEIIGSARIWPLNLWVEGNLEKLAALSRQPGYVSTLRANAPRGIRFEDVIFRAQKYTPLYIGPGVTETEVVDSQFLGGAQGVIVYLDAESSLNVLRNNQFHARSDLGSRPREIIAIDGSDHNRIVGNYFSALNHGGIELYRNCGEDRVVRFTTPSHNQIINNVFYYNQYEGSEAAVVLGSRDSNGDNEVDRDYCGDDSDFPGGSGSDNRSFATHNVVMQNQIYKRSVASTIVTKWTDGNVPNYVAYNEDRLLSHEDRASGCYVDSAYGQFLKDGETTRLQRSSTGAPTCRDRRSRCDDGDLVVDPGSPTTCRIDRIPFACGVSGDNRGCSGSSLCPSGTKLVRAAAACNLEFGAVSSAELDAIRGNDLRVVRASDHVSDGSCHAGSASISSGERVIEREASGGRVYFGCSEHDENGGDCQVRGELYCQNEQPLSLGTFGTGVDLSTTGSR